MNKIILDGLNEQVIHEKLDNGLNIYVLRKKNFNKYSCYFISNYGSRINKFVPIGENKIQKFPRSIAHFLEHKLFEQESGPSVLEKFASLGGGCNAFTNYEYTAYYVEGVDNFEENLLFLIDYVQSPYFTSENVEKEKGIIDQERLRSLDNPYRTFNMRLLKNIFVNYGYGDSIVGTKEEIYAINKEDLYRCYNTFYNPSNMSIIVVSNKDEKEVINLIKENQKNKSFDKVNKIKIETKKEPDKVSKEYDVFYDNVVKPEIGYSIKIPISIYNTDIMKVVVYLYIMINSNFGKISGFNLDIKNKNITDENISMSVDKYQKYIVISLVVSSEKEDEIIKMIEDKLSNIVLSEENFDLIKKSLISRFVYYFSSTSSIMNYLYQEYYDNKTINGDTFRKYKELNFNEYKDVINNTPFDNRSITIMKPLDNKE